MKKLAALCVAALGAALLVLGPAPSASAYPDLSCNLEVDRQVLNPGEKFTATGTAVVSDADDAGVTWSFKWNDVTKNRAGAVASATFTAPAVDSTRKIALTGRASSSLGTCVHHIDITVVGPAVAGPGGGGLLPNTGGPAFWLLVAAVLLLGGGGAVLVARRRNG
jgi:LPXTG-motif cell wall-anchored protein